MRKGKISLLFFIVFSAASLLAASKRPCLRVHFEIKDSRFADMIGPSGVEDLRQEATQALVTALNCQVPFIDFTTDESCQIGTLRFSVERQDPPAGFPGEGNRTWIRITLDLEGRVSQPVFWDLYSNVFRISHWNLDTLLVDLEAAMYCPDDKPRCRKYDDLISEHLSRIALAEGGQFLKNPLFVGWIVPISVDDSCVTFGTIFKIENQLTVNNFQTKEVFDARAKESGGSPGTPEDLQCEALAPNSKLDSADSIVVGRIFVKRPESPSLCSGRPSPSNIAECRERRRQ